MMPPPMPPNPQDESHLQVLKICYYVFSGLGILGLLFLLAHFMIMDAVFSHEELFKNEQGGPPPAFLMDVLSSLYLIIGVVILVTIVLNFMCARAISQRERTTLIMINAGITCLSFPLGTTLGVFTFIICSRPSIKTLFERERGR